mmetsp:Transcript_29606/g.85022  ORF Transcript_29606/g.85022 Transcript_29606/m.85022 type:complete len:272 (+) Transcript_29606:53-868(+)
MSHSRARPRTPESTVSRVFTSVANKFAGSMAEESRCLKKSGSTEATSTSACMHSWRSSWRFARAMCSSTACSTPAVPSSGAQAFFSTMPTISHTSSRAAHFTLISSLAKAFCSKAPSSCCAPTTSSLSVEMRSLSSLMAVSQEILLGLLAGFASLNTRGSNVGQPRCPGLSQPRWSSSQQESTSLEMTSPTLLWTFWLGSASKSCSSPAATCCLFWWETLAKTKSFSEPCATSCLRSTAPCVRKPRSMLWLPTTASSPSTRLSGSDALATW